MNNDVIELRQGTSESFKVYLKDDDEQAITTYTGDEVVSCKVWAGDDSPVLATPSVTWDDAPNGVLGLVVDSATTASLDPALYYLTVEIDQGGNVTEALRCWLQITAAPGTSDPLPYYGTFEDLLRLCPQLQKEQVEGMRSGFAEQRALARQWVDEFLLTRDASNNRCTSSYDYFTGRWNNVGYDTIVKGWLNSDKLMVTPKVVEIVSRKALSIIFETAYSLKGGKESEPYLAYSAKQAARAENLLMSLVAELDTNSDGKADYWIDCTKVTVRGYN